MKNDLANRYVYAVVRHLPQKMQSDVKKELSGLISDMAHEKYGDSELGEKDITPILEELGSPEELALKYCGDERISLVSGANYLLYKRTLKLVLPIVGAVALIVSVIMSIIGAGGQTGLLAASSPAMTVLYAILIAVGATVVSVGFAHSLITFILAMIERKKSKKADISDLSELPTVPDKYFDIKRSDPILGIVFAVLTVVVFLGFPYILGGTWGEELDVHIPLFYPDGIRSLWLPIILWMVFRIAVEIAYLVEKRYKPRLSVIATLLNVAAAICAFIVLLSGRIINPEIIPGLSPVQERLVLLTPIALLVAFMFVLLVETVTTIYKGAKSKPDEKKEMAEEL